MREAKAKVGLGLLARTRASAGPHAALGRRALPWSLTPPHPRSVSAGGGGVGILHLPQLFAGNLWLDVSVSVEPEPKSLWFPGVTTALYLPKAEQSVLALSARTTSGLH